MSAAETIVWVVAIGGFWVVLGLVIYLRHRERLARYQAGWTDPPPATGPPAAYPPGAPYPPGPQYPPGSDEWWRRPRRRRDWEMQSRFEQSARLAGIGLGLLFGLLTLGIGPWLLGGLIPLVIAFGRLGMIAINLDPAGAPSMPQAEWLRRGIRQGTVGAALLLGLLLLGVGPWLLAGSVPLGDALGCLGIWLAYRGRPRWK